MDTKRWGYDFAGNRGQACDLRFSRPLGFVFSDANITSTLVKVFESKSQRLLMQNPCGKVD
jgi:hypothetical protein